VRAMSMAEGHHVLPEVLGVGELRLLRVAESEQVQRKHLAHRLAVVLVIGRAARLTTSGAEEARAGACSFPTSADARQRCRGAPPPSY
jgi:hypothetical protein